MNVVSLLGPLGAWLAALVALLAFSMNYRATLRNQRDTQFYEALKRFGDKDSPSARASAASLLSQIALSADRTWPLRMKDNRSLKWRTRSYPYLEATLNQLLVGLQLETNEVVLNSISMALQRLQKHDATAFDQILKIHMALQDDLANKLGRSYAARIFDYDEETLLHHDDEIYDDWVEAASATTRLSKDQIETIRRNFKLSFQKSLRDANQSYKITHREKQKDAMAEANAPLGIAALRLKFNADLVIATIRETKRKPDQMLHLTQIFIPGADLSYSSLSGCWFEESDLSDANFNQADVSFGRFYNCSLRSANLDTSNLYDAHFFESDLSDADLAYANLDRARFTKVKLDGANLCEAKISGDTWLGRTDWWKIETQKSSSLLEHELELLLALYKSSHGVLPESNAYLTPAMRQFVEPLRTDALAVAKREAESSQSDEVEVLNIPSIRRNARKK